MRYAPRVGHGMDDTGGKPMLQRWTRLVRRKGLRRTAMPRISRANVAGRNRFAWKRRLDDLYKAVVMTTHGAARMPKADGRGWFWYGRCLKCQKLTVLYVSHIEPKGEYPHMRWTIGNAFALCYRCHIHWWHKNPRAAWEFSCKVMGTKARETLAALARYQRGPYRPDHRVLELALCAVLRKLAPRIEGLEY